MARCRNQSPTNPLSAAAIKAVAEAIPAHMAKLREDERDKRLRRGKYAPETGTCKVCSGAVRGVVRYRDSGLIGGPPPPFYVAHWECEKCGLLYGKCPA